MLVKDVVGVVQILHQDAKSKLITWRKAMLFCFDLEAHDNF